MKILFSTILIIVLVFLIILFLFGTFLIWIVSKGMSNREIPRFLRNGKMKQFSL